MVSRRFDGWVSANVGVAAAAGPQDRGRPRPSNPLMRRRVPLALDERGYKADGTSRDRSLLPSDSAGTIGIQHKESPERLDTASRFIQVNIDALRRHTVRALAGLPGKDTGGLVIEPSRPGVIQTRVYDDGRPALAVTAARRADRGVKDLPDHGRTGFLFVLTSIDQAPVVQRAVMGS